MFAMEHCVWNKSNEKNNLFTVTIGGDLVQVLGGRGRRVSAENFVFFICPHQMRNLGSDGGGLTVIWHYMLVQYYHVLTLYILPYFTL